MAKTLQVRRTTAALFTLENPVLASGEIGYETDTKKMKIGDGTTAWSSLSYFGAFSGSGGGSFLGNGFGNNVAGLGAVVVGGISNNAGGTYAFLGGGGYNSASSNYVAICGGSYNNASGTAAVICGGGSNTASQAYSAICGGTSNQVSNIYSFIGGGTNNQVSGSYTLIGGGSGNQVSTNYCVLTGGLLNSISQSVGVIGGGQSNSVSAQYGTIAGGALNTVSGYGGSSPGGIYSVADRYGMLAHASGRFSANGDAQHAIFVLRAKTTNATPATLYLDGLSTRLTIPNGKALFATVQISGINSTGAQAAHYTRKVAIKNVSNTCSLIGAVSTVGTDVEDVAGWDVAITADNTNKALQINVTGAASTTIRWVAVVDAVEIAYGT